MNMSLLLNYDALKKLKLKSQEPVNHHSPIPLQRSGNISP